MRSFSMIVLILLLTASASLAELVEFPMTTLTGTYPGTEPERTEAFVFNMDPAMVNGAFLRIAGTMYEGSIVCDGMTGPYPMEVGGIMPDATSGGWWWAYGPYDVTEGPFTVTVPVTGSFTGPASWNFLGTGQEALTFSGTPAAVVGLCTDILAEPSADITEVTLIFDMQSTVETQPVTWSALKAVYR
jgi:hypothetical protein